MSDSLIKLNLEKSRNRLQLFLLNMSFWAELQPGVSFLAAPSDFP
jgi:hypothetical protein